MKRIITLTISMVFSLHFALLAGEIKFSPDRSGISFSGSNYQGISFISTISAIQFREVVTPKGTFTELYIPGYGGGSQVGDPSLPVLRKLIEVPVNGGYTIQVQGQNYSEIDLAAYGVNSLIIPAQASVSKGITDPADIPFVMNATTYQRNELLASPLVEVTTAGTMRSVRLARIDISPVQYNPVTNRLRVYHSIEVSVLYNNSDVQATLRLKQAHPSTYFEGLYSRIENYQPLADTLITNAPSTYVIVSPPAYQDALRPFVHWKTRKGFKVIQAYTSDPNVGTTTTSIKSYLQGLYNNPPAGYSSPTFILFVGDVPQIPAFTNNGQATDLRYCEYTNDNIPEVFYGRFSANNLVQLQPYIDKVLEYEQYLFPTDSWLNEVVMVAGADASHQMTWGNGQINYGTTYYFNTAHNLTSHTYLQPEPGGGNYSQQIRTNVSNGVSFANYTAHGSEAGWADPEFVISQIPALQNDGKYCLMVGNCCLTSKYNLNCFGEEITRASHKGAIGYIGASNNSYWDEDFWWGCGFKAISANPVYNPLHLGAYDVTFHEQGESTDKWFTTMGQMVVGGNMAVEESSTSSSSKLYYWEIYNLMGDPSVSIYYAVPPVIAATYPSVTMIGTTSLAVTTEPWSTVALSMNDSVFLAAACADSSGQVNLTFNALMNPGMIDIVITKQNRKPLIDSIEVIPASGPYLTTGYAIVNDSIGGNSNHKADYSEALWLTLMVNNIGVQTAYNVTATLSTADTNILLGATSFLFDSIPAQGTTAGINAFGLTVKDFIEDQHKVNFVVNYTSGSSSWSSPLQLTLNAPSLLIGSTTVLDPAPGGNNNGVLDPGETAQLKIALTNKGHSTAVNVVGHLVPEAGSAPFILVTNPNSYIGTLTANGFGFALFNVISNGITPAGTIVNLDYEVTAGQLNQFTAQKEITLTIGQVPQYLMGNGNITSCSGTFFDTGGENGNYANNEAFTMTFYPGTTGAKVKAVFTSFSVEPETNCNYDYLRIYNGTSFVAPVIGSYCGTNSPGTITATNTQGALTFEFHSDYSDNFPGWKADISCFGGPMTLIANAFPPTVCQNGSTQLVAIVNGGSGTYTYQWTPSTYLDDPTSPNPISTPESNISYTVTVNDGTSTLISNPIDVTIQPRPMAPVITETGSTLESSSPTGNRWYLNGGLIPGAAGQSYTPSVSGIYHATVSDPGTQCESAPSNAVYFLMTGTGSDDQASSIRVYPNPFNDRLNISLTQAGNGSVNILLLNSIGQAVKQISVNSQLLEAGQVITLPTGDLAPGVYHCRVATDRSVRVQKVILSR